MTQQDLMNSLSRDPKEMIGTEVKQNPDGSDYLPISVIQRELNAIFGLYSWEFQREIFGKNNVCGVGRLSVRSPADGLSSFYTGTASIPYRGGMRLDYPSLESHCLMNAAKKIGKWFGRDLNRDRDEFLMQQTVELDEVPDTEETKRWKLLIEQAATKIDLLKLSKKLPAELTSLFAEKLKTFQ